MKRISLICILILLCSLPGKSQFWISFGWNEPHCQNCLWMEQAMHLNGRQAADYHKIIHKYGQRIEKEARRHYRYWDQSARKIYDLRMDRDRKLQHILNPQQFRLYVRFVREHPQRIHDYQGWFNNPHYPDYRPTNDCFRYEDRYWHCDWEYRHGNWDRRFDDGKWYPGKYDRPGHDNGHGRPDNNNHSRPENHRPGNNHESRPNRPENNHNQRPDRDRPGSERYSKPNNTRKDSRRSTKDDKEKDKKEKESRRSTGGRTVNVSSRYNN